MSYQDLKSQYATKTKKIVDIFLHKCKYTDQEWVGYGSGTLQTAMSNSYTGLITVSGTVATEFNESFVWVRFGGSDELAKAIVIDDNTLDVTVRGDYGTNPVEHSIGTSAQIIHSGEADGTCYGFTGCSAKNNYVKDLDVLLRFPSSNLEFGESYFLGLESEKPSTPTIAPSESMGSRGKTTISILDGKEPDSYVPYPENRTDKATLWTKLIARNPYFEGRKCFVYEGFDNPPLNLDDFQKREYIIDDVQLRNGKVSIKCMDPLILTEDKKAKAPLASSAQLEVSIINSTTSFTYTGLDYYFGQLGDFVYIRVDSEILYCEVTDTKELTVVDRGFGGTDSKDHDALATVQGVLHYDKVNVVEIIVDLIERFTTVPTDYLDDYTDVISKTSSILLTAWISKPEEVKKLIDELIQTGLLAMWFSPEDSKIKIVRSEDPNVQPISVTEDENIEVDSYKNTRKPSEQTTRFSVAWGLNDLTKSTGDENFSVIYTPISVDKEQPQNKGEVNEKKTFYCRWLLNNSDDAVIAFAVASDEIEKNAEVPTEIEFNLDRKDIGVTEQGDLDLASVISVTTSRRVNPDGSPLSDNYQVINITNVETNKFKVKAKLFQQPISGDDVDFVISENKENYDLSTEFAPVSPGTYSVLVEQGVIIGSTSTDNAGFTTGAQSPGVIIRLINQGQIVGMGGKGGAGGFVIVPSPGDFPTTNIEPGSNGFDGGLALEMTTDLILASGAGLVGGGGGGAGGGTSIASSETIYVSAGNGGSGGQGLGISQGGAGGTAEIDSSPILDVGQNGETGSHSGPGVLNGVSGGVYGEKGGDFPDNIIEGAKGGDSGASIRKNGNILTIESGAVDPNGNIRGPIED